MSEPLQQTLPKDQKLMEIKIATSEPSNIDIDDEDNEEQDPSPGKRLKMNPGENSFPESDAESLSASALLAEFAAKASAELANEPVQVASFDGLRNLVSVSENLERKYAPSRVEPYPIPHNNQANGDIKLPYDVLVDANRPKRFMCRFENCNRGFPSRGHLIRHQRIHTGEKPYKCLLDECTKTFSRYDNMLQHFKTHMKPQTRQGANLLYHQLQMKRAEDMEYEANSSGFVPPSQAIARSVDNRPGNFSSTQASSSKINQNVIAQLAVRLSENIAAARSGKPQEEKSTSSPRVTLPLDPEKRELLMKILPNVEQLREELYKNIQVAQLAGRIAPKKEPNNQESFSIQSEEK